MLKDTQVRHKLSGSITDSPGLYERQNPTCGLKLWWHEIYEGNDGWFGRHHRYSVVDGDGQTILEAGKGEWADWDQRGRLALVRDGKLFDWDPANDQTLRELADFDDDKPSNVPPPPEALVW